MVIYRMKYTPFLMNNISPYEMILITLQLLKNEKNLDVDAYEKKLNKGIKLPSKMK